MLHAIQALSHPDSGEDPTKEERYGISYTPTLKSARGRRDGIPSEGSNGRREFGNEASKDKSYTVLQLARLHLDQNISHTITAWYLYRRFRHEKNPFAQ